MRRIRCPMGDWAQDAPDRATAKLLLLRHANEAHVIGKPDAGLLARVDAKLTHCPYRPPDGRYVPEHLDG